MVKVDSSFLAMKFSEVIWITSSRILQYYENIVIKHNFYIAFIYNTCFGVPQIVVFRKFVYVGGQLQRLNHWTFFSQVFAKHAFWVNMLVVKTILGNAENHSLFNLLFGLNKNRNSVFKLLHITTFNGQRFWYNFYQKRF